MESIQVQGSPSQVHAYDNPTISPIQFMLAVMRDTTLPLSIRLDAAAKVAPFTHPIRANESRGYESIPYRCTIIIGGLPPEAQDLTTGNNSDSLQISHKTLNHSGEPQAPVNLTTIPSPPTPEEIQQIKAAVQALHPDADLSSLPEPRLCECGHWMFYPCKCASVH